jgi:hypothetical protein
VLGRTTWEVTVRPEVTVSRTLIVRGGINAQADTYLGAFGSSQSTFPPQIIQGLLMLLADPATRT